MLEQDKHPLAPFVSLLSSIVMPAIILLIFMVFGALHDNCFVPSNWDPLAIYFYVAINLLLIFFYLSVLSNYKIIDVDSWLSSSTNIDAYADMTKFDSVLAHYTNVATVGLFVGVLIYTGRPFAEDYPRALAFIATLLMFAIFALYALLFTRLAKRFSDEKSVPVGAYLAITIAVFSVDSAAIKMFIDAVPKTNAVDTANKQILSPAKSAGCDVNPLRGFPR
jgi:hypothetical protein